MQPILDTLSRQFIDHVNHYLMRCYNTLAIPFLPGNHGGPPTPPDPELEGPEGLPRRSH